MIEIKVFFYIDNRERNPVKTFLDSLSKSDQAKVLRVVKLIKEHGTSLSVPHLKKLKGTELLEIKLRGNIDIRIILSSPEKNVVLLLHGFKKKSRKTPDRHINRATRRLQDWINRQD